MKTIKRETKPDRVTVALDDHEPMTLAATLLRETELHDAGSETIEGLKSITVILDEALPFTAIGKSGRVTLSDGDSWAVFPKNATTLVRSGA